MIIDELSNISRLNADKVINIIKSKASKLLVGQNINLSAEDHYAIGAEFNILKAKSEEVLDHISKKLFMVARVRDLYDLGPTIEFLTAEIDGDPLLEVKTINNEKTLVIADRYDIDLVIGEDLEVPF